MPESGQQKPTEPAIQTMEVWGALLTWNTCFGLADEEVKSKVREGFRKEALLAELLRLPMYKIHFEAFQQRIQTLASKWGFGIWAVGMELSMEAADPGRIHLHAMLTPILSWAGHTNKCRKTVLEMQLLEWNGVFPDVRPSLNNGRYRQLAEAFQSGLYYVLCDKVGAMFRASSIKLFEDRMHRVWHMISPLGADMS